MSILTFLTGLVAFLGAVLVVVLLYVVWANEMPDDDGEWL